MNIKVAAVQMNSFENYSANKEQAEVFINEAIKKNSQLIILPEMAICGYSFSDSMWNEAEPIKGKTYQWLKGICDSKKVYIGLCILECDGKDFFDTFILVGPNEQLWFHRKVEPAGYEGFFFKGGGINECVFNTPIGKLGVIICFDATKNYIVQELINNKPEIIIIPFAAMGMPKSFPAKPRENWKEIYYSIPKYFHSNFNIPIITCNKSGHFISPMPMGFGMKYEASYFDVSCIIDNAGTIVSSINGKAGIACGNITTNKNISDTKIKGKWFLNVSTFTRAMSECTKYIGFIRYIISKKRKNAIIKIDSIYKNKSA